MKKLCAYFALLLLLIFLTGTAIAETTASKDSKGIKVVDSKNGKIKDADGSNNNLEYQAALKKQLEEDDEEDEEVIEDEEQEDEDTKKNVNGNNGDGEGGLLKSLETAYENAQYSVINGIIDQLFEGSVTIFETETDTDKNGDELVTYKIRNVAINPFEPVFVKKSILYTGAFYLCIAILLIPGSYLMLLIYNNAEYPFVEAMEYLTGEERPYDNEMQKFVCKTALTYWCISITTVFLITGLRNLAISAITPHEVVLPALYADSIPIRLLEGLASFSNAFESKFGVYGIHIFAAAILILGIISLIILFLGNIRGFVTINVILWGMFLLCNFIDVINTGSLSVGIGLYLHYSDPTYVTVGMIFGGVLNIFIAYRIIKWASSQRFIDQIVEGY